MQKKYVVILLLFTLAGCESFNKIYDILNPDESTSDTQS